MKKSIKTIFFGGLVLALFFSFLIYPSATQAVEGCPPGLDSPTLLSDTDVDRGFVIDKFEKIYKTFGYKKCDCPYVSTTLGSRGNTIYECNREPAGNLSYKYNNEAAIDDYLNNPDNLKTCGDFNTELKCIENQSLDASLGNIEGSAVDPTRDRLISEVKQYLSDPSDTNKENTQATSKDLTTAVNNAENSTGIFTTAIGSLTNALIWSIQPKSYGGYTKGNKGVVAIWEIMRDFVNIILVIAMIIMAIATILGIEKYSWKNVLWKIAVVALLVNFSLVIVGMIVDVFNYFTVYFLNSSQVLTSNLGGLFAFHGFNLSFGKLFLNFAGWLFKNIIMLFVWLFVIITLLAAIIAMIVRAIVIMFLAAISPLAFAAWIFPATEKWWKMWWDNFLKWATFGLIFAIALYAGITIIAAIQSYIVQNASSISFFQGLIATLMSALFLVVGLIFSMQAGTEASKFTLAQTGKASGAIAKWAGARTYQKAVGSAVWQKTAEHLEKSNFIPLHKIGIGMKKQKEIASKRKVKGEEDYAKSASSAKLRHHMQLQRDPDMIATDINELAKRGDLQESDKPYIQRARLSNLLSSKEIKTHQPKLYAEIFEVDKLNRKAAAIWKQKQVSTLDQAKVLAISQWLANYIKNSKASKIKEANWSTILNSLTPEAQGDLLLEISTLKPEMAATIFKPPVMGGNEQVKWIRKFVNAIVEKMGNDKEKAIGYLQQSGFYENGWWRAALRGPLGVPPKTP